jgi:hypothetical protein
VSGNKGILIGVGGGIQSYPKAFDPHNHRDPLPVIYPQGEIIFPVSYLLSVACVFSRSQGTAYIDRYVETPQKFELYMLGLGNEFDFTRGERCFGIGVQLQSVTGVYRVGDSGEFDNGLGIKVYGLVRQSFGMSLSAGVKTGIQRIWIQPLVVHLYEKLELDSFNIEVLLYFHL